MKKKITYDNSVDGIMFVVMTGITIMATYLMVKG